MCSDWVPPSTAASAWTVTRARLTSGCCAVSCTPAVWVWKRSISERGSAAPNSSRMILRPHPARGAEFGDLFEQGGPGYEKEGKARREIIDRQARARARPGRTPSRWPA